MLICYFSKSNPLGPKFYIPFSGRTPISEGCTMQRRYRILFLCPGVLFANWYSRKRIKWWRWAYSWLVSSKQNERWATQAHPTEPLVKVTLWNKLNIAWYLFGFFNDNRYIVLCYPHQPSILYKAKHIKTKYFAQKLHKWSCITSCKLIET
jgi:hypothetical protein